jgi:hypothetical protein
LTRDSPPTRTLRYGARPIYDLSAETMLGILRSLFEFIDPKAKLAPLEGGGYGDGDGNGIFVDTHTYFDDAVQSDFECVFPDGTHLTTHTITNCGLPFVEVVLRSRVRSTLEAIERWLGEEMPRHVPLDPPPAIVLEPAAPRFVAEPPNASLAPGEQAIIDLIVGGRSHYDADKEGGHKEFLFRDGRFVQTYGSYANEYSPGEIFYEGPKSFLRDLLQTCYSARSYAATDAEFLEAVRQSIARAR